MDRRRRLWRNLLDVPGDAAPVERRAAAVRKAIATSLVAVIAALLVATAARTQSQPLTIYAASSLTDAFRALDPAQRYSFAASSSLEAQIRNGAPADLFASAAPLNAQRLFRQGLVDRPVTFTSNRLALIVPKSNPAGLQSVHDLQRKPVKLVICGAAVPLGATRGRSCGSSAFRRSCPRW